MAATAEIAVIRARLPYIDRRALSQAWYSALTRFGREQGSDTHLPLRQPLGVAESSGRLPPSGAHGGSRARFMLPEPWRSSSTRKALARSVDQRDPNSAIQDRRARCHVREARCRVQTLRSTSFTVTLGDARVRILAHSIGNRLQLTAVCSSRHAETVRRALAHASVGLQRCGALVDTRVHCEDSAP